MSFFYRRDSKSFYKIGFNIGRTGDILDGWSNQISVPNRFSSGQIGDQFFDINEVRLNIVDVDDNGQLDFVIFYKVHFMGETELFVQIGLNLDVRGHVTDGWTDLKRTDGFDTMALGKISSCPKPLLAGSYIPPTRINGSNDIVYDLHVNITENWLKQGLASTVTSHAPLEDVSNACSECYSGLKLRHCINRREVCKAMVDEVHYSTPYHQLFESTKTAHQFTNDDMENTVVSSNHWMKWPSTASLYCIGFEFLVRKEGGLCEIIDRERAVSKGIEIVMLQELENNGFKNRSLIDSFTLFGNPAGVHGNSQQIVAQFALIVKRSRFKQLLSHIFKRVRGRPEFGGIGKDRLKMKNFYNNGRWFVQFKFDKNHILEGP